MNANATKAAKTAPHACACSGFQAVDASGTQVTTTKCAATTRRTFAPGHDARLKGFLIRAGRLGHLVRTPEGGDDLTATKVADRFGFAQMVRDGIHRTPKKAARKGRKNPAVANPVRKCTKISAKVGRWTYEGELSEHGTWFTYTNKKGEAVNTKKFTQV